MRSRTSPRQCTGTALYIPFSHELYFYFFPADMTRAKTLSQQIDFNPRSLCLKRKLCLSFGLIFVSTNMTSKQKKSNKHNAADKGFQQPKVVSPICFMTWKTIPLQNMKSVWLKRRETQTSTQVIPQNNCR